MRSGNNWNDVEAAGSFERIPAGAYVAKITKVEDHPSSGYLDVEYEIAEGDYKDFFKDAPGWTHSMKKYYTGKSASFFKRFLEAIEDSNRDFSIEAWSQYEDERKLVGKLIGLVIRESYYTSPKDGKDKLAMEVGKECSIYDVRNGFVTLLPPRDTRVGDGDIRDAGNSASGSDDDYVPFS